MSDTQSVFRRLNDVGFALEGANQTPKLIQLMKDAITVIQRLEQQVKAAPPPPESVLSDEEIQSMWCQVATYDTHLADVIAISRSVERAVLQRLQGESRG